MSYDDILKLQGLAAALEVEKGCLRARARSLRNEAHDLDRASLNVGHQVTAIRDILHGAIQEAQKVTAAEKAAAKVAQS